LVSLYSFGNSRDDSAGSRTTNPAFRSALKVERCASRPLHGIFFKASFICLLTYIFRSGVPGGLILQAFTSGALERNAYVRLDRVKTCRARMTAVWHSSGLQKVLIWTPKDIAISKRRSISGTVTDVLIARGNRRRRPRRENTIRLFSFGSIRISSLQRGTIVSARRTLVTPAMSCRSAIDGMGSFALRIKTPAEHCRQPPSSRRTFSFVGLRAAQLIGRHESG
jgi:hypothetical protein